MCEFSRRRQDFTAMSFVTVKCIVILDLRGASSLVTSCDVIVRDIVLEHELETEGDETG
jgi:hypothetical protein